MLTLVLGVGVFSPLPNQAVLGQPSQLYSEPLRTVLGQKKFPLEELRGAVCFLSWVLNWESTENWDFYRLEP